MNGFRLVLVVLVALAPRVAFAQDDVAPSTSATPTPASTAPAAGAQGAAPKSDEADLWLERNGVWGLRGAGLDLRGSDKDEGTFGMSLFTWSDRYLTRDIFAYRASILAMLGGGGGGFEGGLGGGLQWGVRAPVEKDQGPVVRIGFDGLILGNQKLLMSYFEIPTVMVGYQYLRGPTVLEIGGRGGAVVEGRFNTGDDARRRLGGLDYGAYVAAHFTDARVDVWWMRVLAKRSDPKTPVDVIRGAACGYVGMFGACADAWFMRGDVQYGMPIRTSTSEAFYAGLLLGLREAAVVRGATFDARVP
jgi:hypothetical protein